MEIIRQYGEQLKNEVIQRDEFIVKESRRYNVSVLTNIHRLSMTHLVSSIFEVLMMVRSNWTL